MMEKTFAAAMALVDQANAAQLAGNDRLATQCHWSLVKMGKRTKDERIKRIAIGAAAYSQGFIAYRSHRYDVAEKLFTSAIRLGVDTPAAWLNLGACIRDQGRVADALPCFVKAVAEGPEDNQMLTALGNAAYELGDTALASEAWARALAAPTADPAQDYDKSILLMMLEGWRAGWMMHRSRWHAPMFKTTHDRPPTPEWDTSPTTEHIVVFGEQGHGDAIWLLRWLPWLMERAPRLTLMIHRPLVPLVQHSVGDRYPGLTVIRLEDPIPAHDKCLALFDVPSYAGCPEPGEGPEATWLAIDAGDPPFTPGMYNVGLVWAGGKDTHHDWRRSIPFPTIRPLLDVPARWVCLQLDRLDDLGADRERMVMLADTPPTSWLATAHWLAHLDLLITVDTGIAHLAGAMGLETWLLLPRFPDYRWGLTRADCGWYPFHRFYRQASAGAWADVLARVTTDLTKRIGDQP